MSVPEVDSKSFTVISRLSFKCSALISIEKFSFLKMIDFEIGLIISHHNHHHHWELVIIIKKRVSDDFSAIQGKVVS